MGKIGHGHFGSDFFFCRGHHIQLAATGNGRRVIILRPVKACKKVALGICVMCMAMEDRYVFCFPIHFLPWATIREPIDSTHVV